MEDYKPVIWGSEPVSIDKLQAMIQNDQSVADELEIRPRGILGYAELTMYASNTESKGYREVSAAPLTFPVGMVNPVNTANKLKEWTRVIDNWNINPNGLSVTVNVEQSRIIHLELYIPLFVHRNPSAGTASLENWPIDGFIIVRDGEQIVAESGTDIWTGQPGSQTLHSFYYDCIDYAPGAGPHLYEVMWKSATTSDTTDPAAPPPLAMEIWEQNRTTVATMPTTTAEPDQQTYVSGDGTVLTTSASGRYNLSEFTSGYDSPIKYVDGSGYYTGDPDVSISTFAATAPFAGATPTAQFIVTDCGSAASLIFYKEDDQIVQENINADPTA